jgi:hypothetical protein
VTLLRHIRMVFDAHRRDRIPSRVLVTALISLEEADAMWRELRGRKLTQSTLAAFLRPFRIHPRTVWPPRRDAEARGPRGYFRSDFEAAWRAYCDAGAAPSRSLRLRLVGE